MRFISFLFVSLLFVSCNYEINYQNGTKIIFEGKIVDNNNIPIANIPLKVAFYKSGSISNFVFPGSPSDYKEPGLGFTDENGNFKLYVASATNEDEIQVIINEEHHFGYQNKSIVNINDSNFLDYKLNIGTVSLFKTNDIALLKIIFDRVTSPNNIVVRNAEFTGQIVEFETNYNPLDFNNYNSIVYRNLYYHVLKNQNVTIQYDLFDESLNTSMGTFTRNIQINDTNLEEIIQY